MRGGYPGKPGGSIELPIQLTNLKAWFDTRTTAQMVPPPASGAAVQSLASRDGSMGSVTLSQATPANRPLWQSAVSQFGNQPALQYDGAGDVLQAATAADWSFLHGLAFTIFLLLRQDSSGPALQVPFATYDGGATNIGINAFYNAGTFNVRIGNGTTHLINMSTSLAAFATPNVPRWIGITHGGGVCRLYAAGGATASAADTGGQVASAAAPLFPLQIGTLATSYFKGWNPQTLLYDRELSAAEVNSLGGFFAPIYGIAA